jgi:hypothetical protein
MSKLEMEKHEKSLRYARYTYQVVKLHREEVDKVNTCLLNEMNEAVTFRTATRMLRAVRQWRKHAREIGLGPNILPPNVMPAFLEESLPQYLFDTIASVDPRVFSVTEKKYDLLEKALVKAVNRTHSSDNAMQTGEIKQRPKKECWELEISNQPAKLSWRRSGRKKRESSQTSSEFTVGS